MIKLKIIRWTLIAIAFSVIFSAISPATIGLKAFLLSFVAISLAVLAGTMFGTGKTISVSALDEGELVKILHRGILKEKQVTNFLKSEFMSVYVVIRRKNGEILTLHTDKCISNSYFAQVRGNELVWVDWDPRVGEF